MIKALIETLRPRQWTKNLVIFAGLVFDGQMTQLTPFLRVLAATMLFCLVSGITYTLNDLMDIQADRLHPQKKNRPLASGRLTKAQAITFSVFLSVLVLAAAYLLAPNLALIFIAYSLFNANLFKMAQKSHDPGCDRDLDGFCSTSFGWSKRHHGGLFFTLALCFDYLISHVSCFWEKTVRIEAFG